MVIDSLYSFNIQNRESNPPVYFIERMFKVGNNDIFNMMFENAEIVEITKLGPIKSINNYLAYTIKSLGKSILPNPVIFETSTLLQDCGIVKTSKKGDSILFKLSNPGIFEVYIFNGKYSSQLLLLQMLKDGSLDDAINLIKSRIIQ
jgi:hypothetical protein